MTAADAAADAPADAAADADADAAAAQPAREAVAGRERRTSGMCQSAQTLRVFGEVVALEREERERALWYAQAERQVMDMLRASLLRGARELGDLGAKVEVSEPSSAPRAAFPRCSRSLSVRYAKSEVMVYSARTAISLSVHLAWVIQSPRARFGRVLSVPGFAVRCGVNQELMLHEVGPFASQAAVELDQVAWRLLGMLGNTARARHRPLPAC